MAVRIVPALALGDALAGLVSDVYAGYWHPIHVDAAGMRRMATLYDIDLEASVAALIDERPVGVALLAVRGREGWVGGMGVLPEHRRAGIGSLLVRHLVGCARERGVRRIRLEVLEQNTPARAVYERFGFTRLCTVGIWRLDARPPGPVAEEADLEKTLAALAVAEADASWQRNAETVARMRALGVSLRAARAKRGKALLSLSGDAAHLLLVDATSRAAADALLAYPFANGATSVLWLNAPEAGSAIAALRAAGATRMATQDELVLAL
jgi:GNAT superfamily N-acetyltransferase